MGIGDDAIGDDDFDDIIDNDDSLSCIDDSTWSGKFNTAHTCDYVAEDPTNRCRFESSDGISANSACPEACDDECSPPPGVGDDDAIGDDAIGDDDFDDIIDNDDSLSCIDDSTWS